MVGIHHNYSIVFESRTAKTSELYYTLELSAFAIKCGIFLAFVTSVNGAGESDPSNNVTIPSLPDIGPVTASLRHQVWKDNEEIMVNVYFEVNSKLNTAKVIIC